MVSPKSLTGGLCACEGDARGEQACVGHTLFPVVAETSAVEAGGGESSRLESRKDLVLLMRKGRHSRAKSWLCFSGLLTCSSCCAILLREPRRGYWW